MGEKIGYIRVSSFDQNPERQLEGMDLNKRFIDQASGRTVDRPQLKALLGYIREGDTLVVHSMDRLARNLDDLRQLVQRLTSQNIQVEFLKEGLTFTGDESAMSMLLLSVMGAFAEFERSLIKERQKEGITLAKKRGAYQGRKLALTTEQIQAMKIRVHQGHKKSHIARDFGISRETVYQYLKKHSEK